MAGRQKKEEEVDQQEKIDLAPLEKEVESLKKEVESLKKEVQQIKSKPVQSGASSSELAKQLVEALKEITGPNTKGVRNYIRSVFK